MLVTLLSIGLGHQSVSILPACICQPDAPPVEMETQMRAGRSVEMADLLQLLHDVSALEQRQYSDLRPPETDDRYDRRRLCLFQRPRPVLTMIAFCYAPLSLSLPAGTILLPLTFILPLLAILPPPLALSSRQCQVSTS